MKQSSLAFKTRKEAPKDEVSLNARLLIQAGFIHKEMAGVYSLLPLGMRVFDKIKNIIREEMAALGANELSMSALQEKTLWEKTDRWDEKNVDVWFKTALSNGTELGLGFTHEEPITAMLRDHISSYKDLPVSVFQFQTKFRNELRAKSGIMRGREFLMKDLYSFSTTEEQHAVFYEKVKNAYVSIFEKLGIGDMTFPVHATGGSFSKFSVEFQTITDAGEDVVFLDREKKAGVNQEIMSDEICAELGLERSALEEAKTAEVGNIFNLGTKFSEPLGLTYKDEEGERRAVVMGCYGIGIGRAMGVIAEVYADDKGLVWPKSVAPFDVHVVAIPDKEEKVMREAVKIYETLSALKKGNGPSIEVLFDDRDAGAGAKLADADLIGIPLRIVIGSKSLAEGKVEISDRKTGETAQVELSEIASHITTLL
jgi:prolyl-tRNA synthetase